jgi:hypothetical protein
MRASEEFGRFGQRAPAAMVFLGAGEAHAGLHNPDYDFPDDPIGIRARMFMQTLRDPLGQRAPPLDGSRLRYQARRARGAVSAAQEWARASVSPSRDSRYMNGDSRFRGLARRKDIRNAG